MSVLVVTTVGKFVIDLNHDNLPKESLNFLKLCELGFYKSQFFYNLNKDFIVQTGNPQYQTRSEVKETSVWGLAEGKSLLMKSNGSKHDRKGLVSLVSTSSSSFVVGSQFIITLTDDQHVLSSLDQKAVAIGEITEGLDVLDNLNKTIVDDSKRPLEDIIILHTYVLHDPFPEEIFEIAAESTNGIHVSDLRVFATDGVTGNSELNFKRTALEMIGDIDSRIKPSEKVLFVCKLNPITKESDLQIIFQRFGKINNIEIIRDKETGKSLNYGFIEYDTKDSCDSAFLKMDNVLIDDRRIHVDFSQSIAKERRRAESDTKRKRNSDFDRARDTRISENQSNKRSGGYDRSKSYRPGRSNGNERRIAITNRRGNDRDSHYGRHEYGAHTVRDRHRDRGWRDERDSRNNHRQ